NEDDEEDNDEEGEPSIARRRSLKMAAGDEGGEPVRISLQYFLTNDADKQHNYVDNITLNNISNFQRDVQQGTSTRFAPTLKRGFMLFQFKGNLLQDDYQKLLMLSAKNIDPDTLNDQAAALKQQKDHIDQLKFQINNLATAVTNAPADPPNKDFVSQRAIDLQTLANSLIVTNVAGVPAEAAIPNPPITFATNGVSLSYYSAQPLNDTVDTFLHIMPFEHFKKMEKALDATLIDQQLPHEGFDFTTNDEPDWSTANLFIGIEKLSPGDTLSMLFSMREGSEKNPEGLPPNIIWSYLADNNRWIAFPPELVLEDSTNGMTRTGLLRIVTPTGMRRTNTILNPGLHWLKASVVEDALHQVSALPSLLDIRAQAIEAIFIPSDKNDLARLNTPLPAQTISKLAQSRSAVKKVEQPYDSFGGLRPESDATEFYRRVSERLRHRDRAVTVWDYEHLLLEKYRSVAIAKCITHTRYEATHQYPNASEVAPGFVTMSVIPDLTRHPNMVREEPRFSRGDLLEMRDHLLPKTNLFLQPVEQDDVVLPLRTDYLQVVNPQYEPVHVLLTVWFKRGADVNLAKYQINEALRRLLAPWLYTAANGPVFGRAIRRSEIVQLIESMDAVDVIETLEIFHLLEKNGVAPPTDSQPPWNNDTKTSDASWEPFRVVGTHIRPDNARSILTTVAKHTIVQGSDPAGTPPVGKVITVAPRMAIAPPPEDEVETPEKPVEKSKPATAKPAAKTQKAPAKKRK
ncbi:MAG: hypothetical protein IT269_11110, partial [Saprospiraceae bacterium]|nr:hypothetical protein [Saprospiraceae bacterium]